MALPGGYTCGRCGAVGPKEDFVHCEYCMKLVCKDCDKQGKKFCSECVEGLGVEQTSGGADILDYDEDE